jgi:hypothetical protein
MSKTSYIVTETSSANATFSIGASCTGVLYTGLKTFTDADVGSYPAGTVKVSATCFYNSGVYAVSQNCPAYEVETAPKPSLTCELDKTAYSPGNTPVPNSIVTSNGATCGTPSFSGVKTFTYLEAGSYPAGTIKASVSCSYKSVSLPVATQNCPAFTVEDVCTDFTSSVSSVFCPAGNVVNWNGNTTYNFPSAEAICLIIPKSSLQVVDCGSRQCQVNGGDYFTGQRQNFKGWPDGECGYIYINVSAGTTASGWFGYINVF